MNTLPDNALPLTIAPTGRATHFRDPIHGEGEAIQLVGVIAAGNGFPQPGIYAVMRWSNTRGKTHETGFNWDDGYPYAAGPVFLGATLADAQRFMES